MYNNLDNDQGYREIISVMLMLQVKISFFLKECD